VAEFWNPTGSRSCVRPSRHSKPKTTPIAGAKSSDGTHIASARGELDYARLTSPTVDRPILREDTHSLERLTHAGDNRPEWPSRLRNSPLQVDRSFIDAVAATGGHAERRFRFASLSVEGRCARWTGDKCGAIEIALALFENF
jgi:hypothetical protein